MTMIYALVDIDGLPVPDTNRARILLNDYDRSYSAGVAAGRRRQQAGSGNYQLVRF